MKVGIIGSGDVGKSLGKGFIAAGHQVKIGSRSPEKLNDWAKSAGVSTGTFEEVARFGEVIAWPRSARPPKRRCASPVRRTSTERSSST